jgi:hypothetical protein
MKIYMLIKNNIPVVCEHTRPRLNVILKYLLKKEES